MIFVYDITLFVTVELFLWPVSAYHSCVYIIHPANLTMSARIAPCTTLFTMQLQLRINLFLRINYYKQYSDVFVLIVKHLHTYMMIKTMCFFTCVRILNGRTIRLLKARFIPIATSRAFPAGLEKHLECISLAFNTAPFL